MRKRAAIILLLLSWFFATGSQWDFVQTFAWGRMITTYSRVMPVAKAVELTFSGEAICGLCAAVDQAKQQDKNQLPDSLRREVKFFSIFTPVPVIFLSLCETPSWARCETRFRSAPRATPPTPPPRLA